MTLLIHPMELCCFCRGNTVKIYDLASRKVLRTLIGHSDMVNCIAFSPLENILISGSSDTTIKLWDIASGEELSTQPSGDFICYDVAFFTRSGK